MTREDKENLQSKRFTESLLFSCLRKCEMEIDRKKYLTQKYKYKSEHEYESHKHEEDTWVNYRSVIRSVLSGRYPLNKIIRKSKGCEYSATIKEVETVVELIDANDFVIVS